MLYDLYKIIYNLDRKNKEGIYKNWDNIVGALSDNNIIVSSNKRKINWYRKNRNEKKWFGKINDIDTKRNPDAGEYEYVEQQDRTSPWHEIVSDIAQEFEKTAELHNPKTEEHIEKLISLLEKFIGVDNDISYDNICVFLQPISRGVRRHRLKPYRIVNLADELERLSRKFMKMKQKRDRGNMSIDTGSPETILGVPMPENMIEQPAESVEVIIEETDPEIIKMFMSAIEAIKEKLQKRRGRGVHPQKSASVEVDDDIDVLDSTFEEIIKMLIIDQGWEPDEVREYFADNPDYDILGGELEMSIRKFQV